MKKIPIVFTFNEVYALGGSVAIMSLLDSRKKSTDYEIFVLYDYFRNDTMVKLNSLAPIHFVKAPHSLFEGFVRTSRFPIIVGYNMLIPELFKDYDKVIYCDVDVLVRKDLSKLMSLKMDDCYWAGVSIAKKNAEFCGNYPLLAQYCREEYFSDGFMVINTKKMAKENIGLAQFRSVMQKYGKELYFVEQDLWNIVCNKIFRLPLEYLLPDFVFHEQKSNVIWCCGSYNVSLNDMKKKAAIVHYCTKDREKIWTLPEEKIPAEYLEYLKKTPLYNPCK